MKGNEALIITHSLDDWGFGSALSYYEWQTDTIHILKGADLERYFLIHENVHLERRNTFTTLLYVFATQPSTFRLFFGLCLLGAIPAFLGVWFPFLLVTGLYGFMLVCGQIEEFIVIRQTNQRFRELIKNGA